jgi:hypothetical protein
MRRRIVLIMVVATLSVVGAVVPATAGDDNGKGFAEGAFHSLGTGGVTLSFGPAAASNPPAANGWASVRIFGYTEEGEGPSQGQVYCGDEWNVIVTIDYEPTREFFDGNYATHAIDGGDPFVAEYKTPVRQNGAVGVLTQAHGTFLPPGTLGDGEHTVKQTLEHPFYGVFWDPDPVTFYVDNSTC